MTRSRQVLLLLAASPVVAGLAGGDDVAHDRALSGGATTIVIPRQQMLDRGAFSFPAQNLSLTRRGSHFAGNSFFQNPWVAAPASTTARDGLGPVFNTMSCQSCHIKDGRGKPPAEGAPMRSMLVRLSVPEASEEDRALRLRAGVVPDPVYGDQLQVASIPGVAAEGTARIRWETVEGAYDDGTRYELRRPVLELSDLAYGPASADLRVSGRVAPAVIGVGLLDALDDATLEALADPDDADGDGISGRINRVLDVATGEFDHGRFGWKCEQPNVRQQVAAAFRGDIGITSRLFPDDMLTAAQREVVDVPDGGAPEVSDEILDLVTFYTKTLAVPARRHVDDPTVLAGERHFERLGCAACHVPTLVTGEDPGFPELSGQTIHAFTDLLLHDMGEGLADGRPVYGASGSEWRTPPLWGIGLVFTVNRHTDLLHDGRARSLEEAILWHGGEARAAADGFRALDAAERRQLVVFLKSL